jgi:hypothetical protein
MKIMSQEEYARDTTPFFIANDFYEIETARRFDIFVGLPLYSAIGRLGGGKSSCSAPDHGWRRHDLGQ